MLKKIKIISLILLFIITIFSINTLNETAIAQTSDGLIRLVALGDSTPAGDGVKPSENYIRVYAEYVENDLDVEVDIINWAASEDRSLARWVQAVTTDEIFRMDLKNADIITIWIGWYDIMPYIYKTDRVYKKELNMTTEKMGDSLHILFSEITRLADPKETLILVAETGIPPGIVKAWKENNTFQELKEYAYEDWRDYLVKAAEENKIKVVPTYKTYNGPEGNSILPDVYMQSDGIHLSAKGHKLMADIHRNMGYNPLK